MLFSPIALDSGQARDLNPGDLYVEGMNASVATDTTNTNLTITAAMLLAGLLVRNPAGVSNENYDTAANIVAAMGSGVAIAPGTQFKYRVVNLSANLLTGVFAANTGLVGVRGNVLASTTKDFMCTITNGTPAVGCVGTTVNASPVITVGVAVAATITPGMIVTNAAAGTQGFLVLGVNIAAGTVTLNGNATSTNTAPGITFQFSPVVTITGLAA